MRSIDFVFVAMMICLGVESASAQRSAHPADGASGALTLDSTITRQERAVWSAIKAQDSAAFRNLMAGDCLIVSDDRHYTADQYAALLRTFTVTKADLSEVHVVPLSTGGALIHYRLSIAWTQNNKESVADQYVVSVWKRSGSRWLVVFNQDSPAKANTKPST